jgi:apolipoprotein N-acyltransferase
MLRDQEDTPRCHRCRQERTSEELDRILWCEDCQRAERRRAAWLGRAIAFAAAIALTFWIALDVQPAADFRIVWALVIIAAFYLVSRLVKELVYGLARVRNEPGARAGEAD